MKKEDIKKLIGDYNIMQYRMCRNSRVEFINKNKKIKLIKGEKEVLLNLNEGISMMKTACSNMVI